MRRVLFVDDEPNVLSGLRRMLRAMRGEWQMSFVDSGAEALRHLVEQPVDVVVTDIRMPGMDGVELLTEVRGRYPSTIRIVLSGHSEIEWAMYSTRVAHQYLAKPCSAEVLKETVERALSLQETLQSEQVTELVARIDVLPSLPLLYTEVVKEMESEEGSVSGVGRIIARDVAMTAKLLQMVNSAFFGLPRHVSDPAEAASLVGMDILRGMVLSMGLFQSMSEAETVRLDMDRLWRHSQLVGQFSRAIGRHEGLDAKSIDHATMAGMLHDVGKLVLASGLPEDYARLQALRDEPGMDAIRAETELLGCTHAEVGGYLLGIWGLPDAVVMAVANHHVPGRMASGPVGPSTVVYAANLLSHELDSGIVADFDQKYLSDIGVQDHVTDWRELAVGLVDA